MAICMNCGAVHHNDDKHTFVLEDIPAKGTVKRFATKDELNDIRTN